MNAMWEFGGGEAGLIGREMEDEPPCVSKCLPWLCAPCICLTSFAVDPCRYPELSGYEWIAPLTQEKQDEKDAIELKWRRELRNTFKENRERHSLNCDTQLKLQVAKDFMHASFHFPHNLDFRGRAYPIPPHLNHLGNDMCRGLLQFKDGRPLGEEGLYWLKLQVANLWGQDKLSNDDRVNFVDEHIDVVESAAFDPFRHRWWMETDTPFQLLAACFDLSKALRAPDSTQHVSHLTVHQDGSCNGLQHYAALSRDMRGAEQVNLIPSDRPQDVYIGVANLLQEKVNKDLDSRDPSTRAMAEMSVDRVNRKLVCSVPQLCNARQ
jgi:DNA-directed RNA polymerase